LTSTCYVSVGCCKLHTIHSLLFIYCLFLRLLLPRCRRRGLLLQLTVLGDTHSVGLLSDRPCLRDLCKYNTQHSKETAIPRRDSKSQSQQASRRRLMPQSARLLGSADFYFIPLISFDEKYDFEAVLYVIISILPCVPLS
jgi:hypothetical protein